MPGCDFARLPQNVQARLRNEFTGDEAVVACYQMLVEEGTRPFGGAQVTRYYAVVLTDRQLYAYAITHDRDDGKVVQDRFESIELRKIRSLDTGDDGRDYWFRALGRERNGVSCWFASRKDRDRFQSRLEQKGKRG